MVSNGYWVKVLNEWLKGRLMVGGMMGDKRAETVIASNGISDALVCVLSVETIRALVGSQKET